MPLTVHLVQPDDNVAGQLVRAQMRELMETWQQRVVSEAEVDTELGPQATAGLTLLALAWRDGQAVGCGGLRVLDTIGEVTKVFVVPRARGQQLKDQAQLDGWLRDGSAAYVESLCEWE